MTSLHLLSDCLQEQLPKNFLEADWQPLLQVAARHHLLPQILSSLESQPDSIPPELRERVKAIQLVNLARSGELVRILDTFNQLGVDVYPYKGPHLSWQLYGDLGQRECGDLDILVPPEQVEQAASALESLGYHPRFPQLNLKQVQTLHYEYSLQHRERPWLVELKWSICPTRLNRWQPTSVFGQKERAAALAHKEVAKPSPETLALMLCLHGDKHCWDRLLWLYDVHSLCSRPNFSWAHFQNLAQEAKAQALVGHALHWMSELFGLKLPPEPADWASSWTPSNWLRNFLPKTWLDQAVFDRRSMALYRRETSDTAVEYWKWSLRSLLAPTVADLLSCPWPLPAPFFYYLFRPIRLLSESLGLPLFQDPRFPDSSKGQTESPESALPLL